jgi:hypothetical protein
VITGGPVWCSFSRFSVDKPSEPFTDRTPVIALTKYRFGVFGHAVVTAPRTVGRRGNRPKDGHRMSQGNLPYPTLPPVFHRRTFWTPVCAPYWVPIFGVRGVGSLFSLATAEQACFIAVGHTDKIVVFAPARGWRHHSGFHPGTRLQASVLKADERRGHESTPSIASPGFRPRRFGVLSSVARPP